VLGEGDENVRWVGRGGEVLCEPSAIGEVDGEMDGVEGDFGLGEAPSKRFGDLNDIDIAPPHIDWVGSLKNLNNKKIKKPEVMCWNLDFTGVERHFEVDYECENIAFGDIESH
jgi:hypothetical protein